MLALDSAWIEALWSEQGEHWTIERELLAASLEVQHATLRVLVRAFGGKGSKAPEALQVPRPQRAAPVLPVVSPLALGRLAGGKHKAVSSGR